MYMYESKFIFTSLCNEYLESCLIISICTVADTIARSKDTRLYPSFLATVSVLY